MYFTHKEEQKKHIHEIDLSTVARSIREWNAGKKNNEKFLFTMLHFIVRFSTSFFLALTLLVRSLLFAISNCSTVNFVFIAHLFTCYRFRGTKQTTWRDRWRADYKKTQNIDVIWVCVYAVFKVLTNRACVDAYNPCHQQRERETNKNGSITIMKSRPKQYKWWIFRETKKTGASLKRKLATMVFNKSWFFCLYLVALCKHFGIKCRPHLPFFSVLFFKFDGNSSWISSCY